MFAKEQRVVDFFSPYYMCEAINRLGLTSFEESKTEEKQKKKKTKVDEIPANGDVPS